ncbi:MAG: hypothetical protein RLZZ262_2430, partial [Bacteroidota bacterium]
MKKLILLGLACALVASTTYAQKDAEKSRKKSKSKKEQPKEAPKEEDKFGDLVKKCTKSEGLFTIYRDTVSGKSYLQITEAQLGKEFIYFNHIEDAPVEAGYFRGSFGDSKVIHFRKAFER